MLKIRWNGTIPSQDCQDSIEHADDLLVGRPNVHNFPFETSLIELSSSCMSAF